MESTIKDISELKPLIKEIGYLHATLETADGERIIAANQKKVPILDKLKEIEKRLKVCPKGIYRIGLRTTYGRGIKNDYYYINTGKEAGAEQPQPIIIREKLSESNSTTNVLTYDKALEYIQKIAELENENKFLKAENEKLKIDIAELEAEEEEEEKLSEQQTNDVNWLSSLFPSLLPIAERYFDIEEKKLQFQAVKFAKEIEPEKKSENSLPKPGSGQYNNLLKELAELDESEFLNAINEIKKINPEYANQLLTEFQ